MRSHSKCQITANRKLYKIPSGTEQKLTMVAYSELQHAKEPKEKEDEKEKQVLVAFN